MNDSNRTIADEAEGDEIQKIKDEFKSDPETVSLNINRVPKYVSDELKDLANERFAGDYGMALTHWRNQHNKVERLYKRIADLNNRIAKVERAVKKLISEDTEDENNTESLDTLN